MNPFFVFCESKKSTPVYFSCYRAGPVTQRYPLGSGIRRLAIWGCFATTPYKAFYVDSDVDNMSSGVAACLVGAAVACVVLLPFACRPPAALSQPMYKVLDDKGRVVYSTSNSGGASEEAELPEIKRENIDRKIAEIKSQTPDSCDGHAGVDCQSGPDADGSVICVDGYRNAKLPFRFRCLEANLQILNYEVITNPVVDAPNLTRRAVRIAVHNKSDAVARDVVIRSRRSRRSPYIQATGPTSLDPYLAEDFVIDDGGIWTDKEVENIRKDLRIECRNCQRIKGR